MNPTGSQLSVISAIVTPALLILACSSLITATATRLSRLLERVRDLTKEIETGAAVAKRDYLAGQLGRAAIRTRFLQSAMIFLYLALGTLVLSSASIGLGSVTSVNMIPFVVFAVLTAVAMLFGASILLIRESRLALKSVDVEIEYVRRLIG